MQNLCRRNRRRRSSKGVPKEMQNLYHRNRRWRRSKDVPKGMQSLCVLVWACGCVSSASSLFCIILSHHFTQHHIIHHIASMTRGLNTRPIFGKCFVKLKKGAKARSKFWEIQFYQPCCKKGSLFTKHGYLSLRSTYLFIYEAWKEGKVFFRRRLKNGMCVNFIHRKEINYNNLHIQFNFAHSKYYIVLLQKKPNLPSFAIHIKLFKILITIRSIPR
jgi:hypothetical protein